MYEYETELFNKYNGEDPFSLEPVKVEFKKPNRDQCREFMRDVKGMVWGDADHADGGTLSTERIAELMRMPVDYAVDWLYNCADYGFTDLQGGNWVV